MNDLDNVYIAFEIDDPIPGQARLTLIFDCSTPSDGIADDGVRFEQITAQYSDLDADLNPDGHIDGVMTSNIGAASNYFEVSKPIGAPDPDDCLFPKKLFVIYRSGPNVFESTDWQHIQQSIPHDFTFDIRHPEKVSVSQNTFITLDVDFTLLEPDLAFDADLLIIDMDDDSVLDSISLNVFESMNV